MIPVMETQTCSRCGVTKDLDQFSWRKEREQYYRQCKRCRYDCQQRWKDDRREKMRTYSREYARKNPEKRRQYARNYRQNLRTEVFGHYGTSCACCGEDTDSFLAIDHIDNDGAEHKATEKITSGTDFYRWLKAQGWPEGFQTLCHNCNFGKHLNGGTCPHEES